MDKTVLIVDDSRVSRMMLSTFIKAVETEWQIVEAENGQQAIEKAAEFEPTMIIMDINMPVLDGLSAAALLKPNMPSTTIVILTANIQASSRDSAKALGIHLLAKPISEAVVSQAFEYWVKEHE